MAVTPIRNLRVDDERWARWARAAEGLGVSVAVLVREAVDDRVDRALAAPADRVADVFADAGMTVVEHMPARLESDSVETVRARAGMSSSERRRGRERTSMCPHRLPPSSYCAICDK